MRFKKIALALLACLALGAYVANAAQAAEGEGWTIEGSGKIASGTHQRVSCKKHGTSSLVFTSTLKGAAVEITAEGVDCLEKAGSTNAATIDNTTKAGHSEGVLTFTGVKVVKPANCEVAGGELTTSQLTDEVIMDPSGGSVVFDKFFPETAANGFISIEFAGALCSIAESVATVKGTACGESVHTNAGGTGYEANKTGELRSVQTLLFGSGQQTTGGCALTFGNEAAGLSGAVDNELVVTNAGKAFGSD